MLTQDEAEEKIRAEWLLNWPEEKRTQPGIIAFYSYLEKHKPNLLRFRYSGPDKYQKVKSFLKDLTLEYNRP